MNPHRKTSFEMMSDLLNRYVVFCNNRRSRQINLIKEFGGLIDQQQQEKRASVVRLIQDLKPHVERIIEDRKTNALDFNVFEALGVTRKETIQSRFLACLLSPDEKHYQGTKFLNAFLALIDIEPIQTEKFRYVRVLTEHHAGNDLGRMDIVVDYKSEWLIVIENKIDAGEGDDQLSRYNKWLEKQNCYKSKHLVFLTPTGHEAETGQIGSYKQLSYLDIAGAFGKKILPDIKQDSVKTVIRQYISICHLIGGSDMESQDKKLIDLITEKENFRAALELEKHVKLARMQVAKDFGKSIETILQNKIDNILDLKKKWRSSSWTDGDGSTHVDIRTLLHHRKPNYSVRAEYVFTNGGKGWYGWYRPQWVDLKQPQETAALREKMTKNGWEGEEGWWVTSSTLRNGALGYVLAEIDSIIKCSEDIRSDDHPLANEIAEELWEVFTAYLPDIESLDGFKSA